MPSVHTNGIDIYYEVSGQGQPLLVVMGLGGQLSDWHPAFIEQLESHFTVIRFDNRDIGLSTHSQAAVPTRWQLTKASLRPRSVEAPYVLQDMADDAAGLIGVLGYDSVHVLGMSMGGMIAQTLAIHHPDRVRSLCSVMSHPGDGRSGQPTLRVLSKLARRRQPSVDTALDTTLTFFKLVGGRDWDRDEQAQRGAYSIQRSYHPAGMLRQTLAIACSPDRTSDLERLSVPTVVIHGLDDTLVRPSGGIATAEAIPDSRLIMYPRMGHDLPATRHDEMVNAILRNVDRANTDGAASEDAGTDLAAAVAS